MSSVNDLIPSYSFTVRLDGISCNFARISNISSHIELGTIIDGGHNASPILLAQPESNPDMIVLEKGTYTSFGDFMLSVFEPGTVFRNIDINVLRNGDICRIFLINNGVVVARELSNLDALQSAVFIESIQIAHTGIIELPVPQIF